MSQWRVEGSFGLQNLRRSDGSGRAPGPSEIRVRIEATSLNYRDLLMVQGHYNPRQPLPLVPLSDGAGVVEAVGEQVSRFAVGDRVIGCFAPKWLAGPPKKEWVRGTRGGPLPGMLQGSITDGEDGWVKAPAGLSAVEAATLPCAALTAWSALVPLGGITAGDTVLVLGTGGVGIFSLQLAQALGARVIVASGSDGKRLRAEELGAWKTLDYRTEGWGKKAAKLAGDGVDLVVELAGAASIGESLKAVRLGGTIAQIGNLGGNRAQVDLVRVLMNQLRLQGVLVGHRTRFEAMNRAIEAAGIRPIVDRVFSFDEAPEAFAHLKGQGHFGKICIEGPG